MPRMSEEGVKVNIGSGAFPKAGFINVDVSPETRPDIVHDLNRMPYPFAASSVARVEADHVLEHLNDPFAVMRELHRVLRPGGEFIVRVPHFSRGFTHADHRHGFDITFPLYFRPTFRGGYAGVHFECRRTRLRWTAQLYLKRTLFPAPVVWILAAVGGLLNVLANLSPALCSRLWCFWVGGFEEIEFQFLCRK